MNKDPRARRLPALAAFLIVTLAVYAGVLYHTQITDGDYYLQQSVRTITQRETVEASRGIITDRNGTTLVANRLTYNLTFDASLLSRDDDENAAILRLIQLLRSNNIRWTDTLPLSSEAPYQYTLSEQSSDLQSRFFLFLQDKKLLSSNIRKEDFSAELLNRAGILAPSVFTSLRTLFEIPEDWSMADARAVIGVRYELEIRTILATTSYIMVKDVDSALLSVLNDGQYLGVKVNSATARTYETDYAAHILGYVGALQKEDLDNPDYDGYPLDATVGRSGVERAFESYLRGTDGTRLVSFNSEGKVTSETYTKDPQPGSTVELTIDLPLQEAAEKALANTVSKMTAADGDQTRGAGVAVIQVGTGDVLALASYPTYQLATFRQDSTLSSNPGKPMFNRATSGTYAPGSTFKPLTAVAGLEEGVITTSTKIRDTGHWIYPTSVSGTDEWGFWCWNRSGHGLLNVSEAITNSCNYFFGQVGYLLGLDKLNEYALAFGLGKKTGIEIGDAAGNLAQEAATEDLAPWAAFGQANYAFTPLQLANYIATLVSGGQHYSAHLLRTVKSYDNTKLLYTESTEPLNTVRMSDSTLSAVKKGMHDLTTSTLAPYFNSCVVSAGAKTGTAQISSKVKNNGVFVCFAPYENPQVALAIVIEKGGTGAALASTAVEILNAYFTADEIGTAVIGDNTLLP